MLEEIKDVICEYADVDKNSITEDTRFVEDLGFTSYDFMSMLGELEEEFDVEADMQEVAKLRTVQEAADYLEQLQAE